MPKSVYSPHYKTYAEGSIFIDKEGACTITLTGAASMSQKELDVYGALFAEALNEAIENEDESQQAAISYNK